MPDIAIRGRDVVADLDGRASEMRIAEYVLKAAIALRMPLASDDQPDDREEPRERGAPTQVVSSSP